MLRADVAFPATIASDDCKGSAPNIFVDHYEMNMAAGTRYQIEALGTGLGLEVGRPNGQGGLTVLASSNNPTGSTSLIFQPQNTEFLVVNVIGVPAGRTGPYTLRVTRLP